MPRRYLSGTEEAKNAVLLAARRRAQVFRSQQIGVAFPKQGQVNETCAFLCEALSTVAGEDWAALREDPSVTTPGVRRSIRSAVAEVASTAIPLVLAGIAYFTTILPADLKVNVALTLTSWSVLSLLSAINPRRFETQLSAAKTLGELMGKA